MAARVICARCASEQDAGRHGTALCFACGGALWIGEDAPVRDAAELEADEEARRNVSAQVPTSAKISDVFEVPEGDLARHAATLPREAPRVRFEQIEELEAGDKRRSSALALVPLWGLWWVSRSERHTPGERLFLGVLSVTLSVALAFVLTTFRPDREIRIASVRGQVEDQLEKLAVIVEEYHAENGRLPTHEDWQASSTQADRRFYDPWGRPYLYDEELGEFRIGTYGEDGRPGGREEDEDVFLTRSPEVFDPGDAREARGGIPDGPVGKIASPAAGDGPRDGTPTPSVGRRLTLAQAR